MLVLIRLYNLRLLVRGGSFTNAMVGGMRVMLVGMPLIPVDREDPLIMQVQYNEVPLALMVLSSRLYFPKIRIYFNVIVSVNAYIIYNKERRKLMFEH